MCGSRKFVLHAFFMGLMLIQLMFLFWPVPAEGAHFSPSPLLQFIYIDANVGGSSGGHSALRIRNTIYHFQYFPSGLFKLVREQWPHFRYIYNDLENRTLYVAHIHIENRDLQMLQESLDRYYLIQVAHMARLDDLTADTELLNDLSLDHNRMSVNGAGLFSFDSPANEISKELRSAVIESYGKNYLKFAMETLDRELKKIPPVVLSVEPGKISNEVYPPPMASFSNKYAENRLKWAALNILNEALPIRKVELTDMDHFVRPGHRKGLTRNERHKLSAYAETLKTSVIHLPTSSRPDWGYPLLLANARYQAVMDSLKRNSLCLLDPFPESAKSVPPQTLEGDPIVTARLADRAWRKYRDIRRSTFAGQTLDDRALDERSYNRLEESAGRFAELEKGRLTGKTIRVAYGRLIPSRSGMVALSASNLSQQAIKQSLNQTRLNRNIYNDQLKRCYPYDLIDNNCATELIRNINTPFQSQGRITKALGGEIVPGKDFGFIPFRLFGLVNDRFRVTKVDVMPGYRKRMLLRAAQNEPDHTSLYFRECNTLTSTLYPGVKGDTPFLFFTDDVVWLRPVYGALNGAYGLIAAALGIFTLPMDGGNLSILGLKGALYSLPELFFFNIRKGSYNYVDDPANSEIKTLERSAPAFDRHV
ncbi:MAG: hypothetical protein GY846_25625, partial [Deltaproteobacteria bacterium]|nr:hypothetical protein [Deltaproteobacteria bacterium]